MSETKIAEKKRSAEEWVTLAKVYGEECVNVQRDKALSKEQKLEKQQALSKKIMDTIQNDPSLSTQDKEEMRLSIQSYLAEWKRLSGLVS